MVFIGVDGHIVVLMQNADWQKIGTDVSDPFRRGLYGFVPFFRFLLQRLSPFLAYGIVSAVLYGIYIVYVVFAKGQLFIRLRVSVIHVLLFAVLVLWLLVTTLFYASYPDLQPRLLIEPNESVYQGAPVETITALKNNFTDLKDRGCLTLDSSRNGAGGAKVYEYRGWCMQVTFVRLVLGPLAMIMFFIVDFLVLGTLVLRLIRLKPAHPAVEFFVALSTGVTAFMTLLWLFALFGLLNGPLVWGLLILLPIAGYRETLSLFRRAWQSRWEVQSAFYAAPPILFWLLISIIVFNFFSVVRPFPIGWDDLGRYINLPRQLSVTNQILPGIPAIQWEYLTSLGFLLFGYFSTFGAILAQQINWMAGLFAILAVYVCTKMVLGHKAGLLAALLYYLLPMTGHFSFADMKTENALLFFGVAGFICVLLYAFDDLPWGGETNTRNNRWLILGGILLAAAFATKPTMVLMALMSGIVLTFAMLGRSAGIGSLFFSLVLLLLSGRLSIIDIVEKMNGAHVEWLNAAVSATLVVIGTVLVCLPPFLRGGKKILFGSLRAYGTAVALLIAGFILFSAPWIGRDIALSGKLSLDDALKAPNTVTPWVRYSPEDITANAPKGSRALPPELAVDRTSEMCQSTATAEELDRYWGYGKGPMHYLGLPWRVVMNIDSQGYYLTTSPALLMAPLILLLPLFWKRRALRTLFFGTMVYVVVWAAVANGIPWYGIGMFVGLAVCLEGLVVLAPDALYRSVASVLIAIALMTSMSFRLWQFGMQYNLYEFGWGKASAEVLNEMTIPDYDDVAEKVLELSKNPDRPFLYRMGTFISYFIPGNREVIAVNDNQLEFFNCLNQEQDHVLTLKRLLALGFHSIVFDTNTATIEKDINGTLHQKVNRFLSFANDTTLNIQSIVNNPANGIAYMVLPESVPADEGTEGVK